MARGYCCASLVMLSEFLLWASAIGLALCGYILTQRDIIALVGVAIPQVAMGLGLLALIIAIWGRMADYRRWQCGFYIMAISLIFLFLAEVLVVGYQQLGYSDSDNEDSNIWTDLDEADQNVVMSNYRCCGWVPQMEKCQNDISYPYFIYRDKNCRDETKDDYQSWVMTVTIIFSGFAGFHLLYTCIPCLGQAKRLQMKAQRQEEANKRVVRDALVVHGTNQSPRGSWFFRKSPRQKQQTLEKIKFEDRQAQFRHATELTVPGTGHTAPSPGSPSATLVEPISNPGSPV